MQVVLLKDIDGLGDQFETVTVKPGYGRNYLLPKKLALTANKANQAMAKERLKQINIKEQRIIEKIASMIDQIQASPIRVGAKVGTTDKIFGSVGNVQIADAIKRQTGVEIDRRKISIPEEVKTLGNYKALINMGENHKYEVDFEVFAE